MFERALIYNPAFGSEQNIDPQLVYSWCADDHDLPIAEGLRQIGVVQGIVELAHSFGNHPAKYFKTGTGNQARYTIVAPLLTTNPENWRLGFWFAGQIVLPPDCRWMTPNLVHTIVVQAFSQQRLVNGEVPCVEGGGSLVKTYWSTYVASLNAALVDRHAICQLALAPNSIRVAPGMLDPSTQQSIEDLRTKYAAKDIMVLTADDGAAVYAGNCLNIATRRSLQRWLYFQTHRSMQERTSGKSTESSPPLSPQPTNNSAVPDPRLNTALNTDGDRQPLTTTTSAESVEVTPDLAGATSEDRQPSVSPEPQSSSGPSKSRWWPSFSSIASVSLPSVPFPTVPLSVSLPSVPLPSVSLPSVSLSSVSKVASSSWWSTTAKPECLDGLVIDNAMVYDVENGVKYSVSVGRQALYLYVVVYASLDFPIPIAECETAKLLDQPQPVTKLFESLALSLEGFSFAFAPPTKFYYLINDPDHQKMVCTFPASDSTLEALPPLMAFDSVDKPQVVRSGATCLSYTQLPNGIRAVFGKKNRSGLPSNTLLGIFEVDAQQWLKEYVERRILA